MKHIRKFNESFDEYDAWEGVQSMLDVYQLYELLIFKYGNIFPNSKNDIDEYDGDYNPDHLYETIEMELKNNGKWEDFLKNYSEYQNEKDEADPYHWKHRKKIQDELSRKFRDDIDDIKF